MELKESILIQLDTSKNEFNYSLGMPSQAELDWSPTNGCQSIALLLFHVIRAEDNIIQVLLQDKKEIWESGKYYQKFNLAPSDSGRRMSSDFIKNFRGHSLRDLLGYLEVVRQSTLDYIKTLKPNDWDKRVTSRRMGADQTTVAVEISSLIPHINKHTGEIACIRNIQKAQSP